MLKNMYDKKSLTHLAKDIMSVYSTFDVDGFLKSVMDRKWGALELKGRVRHISVNLGNYLPASYKKAIGIIDKIVMNYEGFFGIIFPDFVELYGRGEADWDLSMDALARYTVYSSSEFAVRPFIIKDEKRMMAQMYIWSEHENEHIRRLSSEGCRPSLPWAQALVKFKKDPSPILPILERLKSDPSLYVRKSVANNLNDISKTHVDLAFKLAKNWYGKNEHTDWIVKRGLRTLLKKGSRDALSIFGYQTNAAINVSDFVLAPPVISIGEDISFSFVVSSKSAAMVRLEYGIDYVKSNGTRNRKIFKIAEVSLGKNGKKSYAKKHSFADLSTRRHYHGLHSIFLIVNGAERGKLDFELKP